MLKLSSSIVFIVFVIAILLSSALGMAMIWYESLTTPTNIRILGSCLLLMAASLFYTGACDSWVRILSFAERKKNTDDR